MNSEEILKTQGASGVIISACSLWSHIAAISLTVFITTIIKPIIVADNTSVIISAVLFLLTQFICLRLNLDCKLFKVMENSENISACDEGIKFLFDKDKSNTPIEKRWLGTKRLIKKAYLYVLLQTVYLIFVYLH